MIFCVRIGLQALKRLQPYQTATVSSRMSKPNISQAEVKARLHYDPETGMFTWRNGTRVGKSAGSYTNGYREIILYGVQYRAHRLAWVYVTGKWPIDEIDHINRVKDDNRFVNLREADRFLNNQNASVRSDNASGYRGVSFRRGRWLARIWHDRKAVHLGFFDDFDDAVAARKQAEIDYHGN